MIPAREEVEMTSSLLQGQDPPLEPQPFMEKPGKESSEKPSEWSRGEKIQHGGDGEEGMPTSRGGQIQDV